MGAPTATDGCDVHPRCLECPLPACKHDDPAGYRQWLAARGATVRVRVSSQLWVTVPIIVRCKRCGAVIARGVQAVYCSARCRKAASSRKISARPVAFCKRCGEVITRRIDAAYCSKRCRDNAAKQRFRHTEKGRAHERKAKAVYALTEQGKAARRLRQARYKKTPHGRLANGARIHIADMEGGSYCKRSGFIEYAPTRNVCADCERLAAGARCVRCGYPLSGRQRAYCSAYCRKSKCTTP